MRASVPTDSLTGALSRFAFDRDFEAGVRRAGDGLPFSLALVDLDYLKSFNDAYGHRRGDEALRALSDRMMALLPAGAGLYRYGGDEFAVLAPLARAALADWAERLLLALEDEPFGHDPPLYLAATIGVAGGPEDLALGLFEVADARLLSGKRAGRGRVIAQGTPADGLPGPHRLLERDEPRVAAARALGRALDGQDVHLAVGAVPGVGLTAFLDEVDALARGLGYTVARLDGALGAGRRAHAPLLEATVSGGRSGHGRSLEQFLRAPPDEPARPVALLLDRPDLLDPHSRQQLEEWFAAGTRARVVVTGGPQPEAFAGLAGRAPDHVTLAPLSEAAVGQLLTHLAPRERAKEHLASWLYRRSGGLPGEVGPLWRSLLAEARLYRTTPAALASGAHHGWEPDPGRGRRAERQLGWRLATSAVLVGRQREFSALRADLHAHRVVTLHGPSGHGKTRLALQLAWEERRACADGVVLVELGPVPRDRLALAIANALGLDGEREWPEQRVARYLNSRRSLVVLDGLTSAQAGDPWLRSLVEQSEGTRWLVTANHPVYLPGEVARPLGPIGDPGEARALFLQAAGPAGASLAGTPSGEAALARIVTHVGASPLGLELAASWLGVYGARELADALEGATLGVEAALRHFWAQLLPHEERSVAALGLLADGFDARTAREVGGVSPMLLSALIDRGFVRARGDGTHALPGVWRDSARQRLGPTARNEVIDRLERHARERLAEALAGGAPLDAVERLYAWMRGTTELLAAERRDAAALAAGLRDYLGRRGRLAEGVKLLRLSLQATPDSPYRLPARAALGHLLQQLGEHADAAEVLQETLRSARKAGAVECEVDVLLGLGRVRHRQSRYGEAREWYASAERRARNGGLSQAAALARGGMARADIYLGHLERAAQDAGAALEALGNAEGRAGLLNTLGLIALERRDLNEAESFLREALALEEADRATTGVLLNLTGLAWLQLLRGEYEASALTSERVLRALGETGGVWETANALVNLGHARVRAGQWQAAEVHYRESLELTRSENSSVQVEALAGLAMVWFSAGQAVRAAELFTALLAHPAANAEFRQFFAEFEQRLQQALGRESFAAAQAAGAGHSWEGLLAGALTGPEPHAAPPSVP